MTDEQFINKVREILYACKVQEQPIRFKYKSIEIMIKPEMTLEDIVKASKKQSNSNRRPRSQKPSGQFSCI